MLRTLAAALLTVVLTLACSFDGGALGTLRPCRSQTDCPLATGAACIAGYCVVVPAPDPAPSVPDVAEDAGVRSDVPAPVDAARDADVAAPDVFDAGPPPPRPSSSSPPACSATRSVSTRPRALARPSSSRGS